MVKNKNLQWLNRRAKQYTLFLYNSVIATFCHNIANDLPITVSDPSVELQLLYIDDLVEEMLKALKGKEHRCNYDGLNVARSYGGKYCYVPTTHHVTLGEIVDLLESFKNQPNTLVMPEIAPDSFVKKLYSTYLSYLPKEKIASFLRPHLRKTRKNSVIRMHIP